MTTSLFESLPNEIILKEIIKQLAESDRFKLSAVSKFCHEMVWQYRREYVQLTSSKKRLCTPAFVHLAPYFRRVALHPNTIVQHRKILRPHVEDLVLLRASTLTKSLYDLGYKRLRRLVLCDSVLKWHCFTDLRHLRHLEIHGASSSMAIVGLLHYYHKTLESFIWNVNERFRVLEALSQSLKFPHLRELFTGNLQIGVSYDTVLHQMPRLQQTDVLLIKNSRFLDGLANVSHKDMCRLLELRTKDNEYKIVWELLTYLHIPEHRETSLKRLRAIIAAHEIRLQSVYSSFASNYYACRFLFYELKVPLNEKEKRNMVPLVLHIYDKLGHSEPSDVLKQVQMLVSEMQCDIPAIDTLPFDEDLTDTYKFLLERSPSWSFWPDWNRHIVGVAAVLALLPGGTDETDQHDDD